MKNSLSLVLLFLYCGMVYSQPTDPQWMVWDNKGKESCSTSVTLIPYNLTSLGSNAFYLKDVSTPINNTVPPYTVASHDIFLIYADGSYLDTRYSPDYSTSLNYISQIHPHYYIPSNSNTIAYLYLTRKYDPIKEYDAKVENLAPTTTPIMTFYPNSQSSTNNLRANHSIVYNSDITLYFPKNANCTKYHLTWDNGSFDTSRVFVIPDGTSCAYGMSDPTLITNGIEIVPNRYSGKYVFVNLKAKDNVKENNWGNQVCFKLQCADQNATLLYDLCEAVGPTHDPNYLKVMCIKKLNSNRYKINYHVQFYNDGQSALNHSKIKIKFSNDFDMSSIQLIKWRFGDSSSCSVQQNKFKLTKGLDSLCFEYNPGCLPDMKLEKYIGNINSLPLNKTASVDFCITINKNAKKSIVSIRPSSCETNFYDCQNPVSFKIYPIMNFFDLRLDSCSVPSVPNLQSFCRPVDQNCQCSCPPGIQNDHHAR